MARNKPVTVLAFDILFWGAFLLEAAAIIEYAAISGDEIASTRILLSSTFCFFSNLILWYLTSIQRFLFSVGLIGTSVIVKMSLYIQLPLMYWESLTWLSLRIFPLLLLVAAMGCMATPSAGYWRRREHELTIGVFE